MNILITGGASGLGRAITLRLAKEPKNRVYFTYSKSIPSAAAIEKEFSNTKAIKCDFTNEENIAMLKSQIHTLDLDVLINNAYSGAPIKTYFHKILPIDFTEGFTTNIVPTILLTNSH